LKKGVRLKQIIMIEKRDPLAISEIKASVQSGRDALMAL